jgi:eukaryotic-like serine/threonine-protein kinase
MTQAKLIGQRQGETPAESKSTPAQPHRMPADLLRQASKRLQILALIGAALWVLGPGMGHVALYLTSPGDLRWAQFGTTDAIAAVEALIALGLYGYLRGRDHDPEFVMNLALVYMVFCAAGIALMFHLGPPGATPVDTQAMISWIGPIILMFAALAPGSPWKMLGAGFVAASMDPLGMVIAQAQGHYHYGPFYNALIMHYPSYLLLGVAVVISHTVTRLGRQVAKERELGSYRLGELLGRGGMGEVYRATHRMLARPAAIKLIRSEVLAERSGEASLAVTRFRREAEAAANLRSPHTVELYDFGVAEDGTLYFVMELLQGMDLETLVQREGPLPAKRVIHILRQVCESLEEAHVNGLVHRDIKPANIHVGRLGLRQDFVKVLDFGLVKSVGSLTGVDSMATAAGLTPGTPAYMAPEIALGQDVDGRADLYALGCVAYYLLTGRLVFEGAASFQVIAKHIQEVPVPPSQRTELEIDPVLDRLVLSCLAKNPEDRPQTAEELDRELGEVQTEPWSQEDAQRWWRQHQPT